MNRSYDQVAVLFIFEVPYLPDCVISHGANIRLCLRIVIGCLAVELDENVCGWNADNIVEMVDFKFGKMTLKIRAQHFGAKAQGLIDRTRHFGKPCYQIHKAVWSVGREYRASAARFKRASHYVKDSQPLGRII